MKEFIALTIIFSFPAVLVIVRNILWDTYFWQIKEYRLDRFRTHLFWDNDETNRSQLTTGIKYITFAMLTLVFSVPAFALLGMFIAYFIWINEILTFATLVLTGQFKRPAITLRNLLVFGLSIVTVLSIFALITIPFISLHNGLNPLDTFYTGNFDFSDSNINNDLIYPDTYLLLAFLALAGLFMDIFSPVIVSIWVLLTSPLSMVKRTFTINKAKSKYDKLKANLMLIGITGSQGKTTTKEILYELLKEKFVTAKTPENYNTDFGVAVSILNKVFRNTEVFIAEMGAYKQGEIKRIVSKFTPDISIITDMDTQHLGLFGSRTNLMEAKGEIVRYMKQGGVAIVNGDNEYCIKSVENFDGEIKLFSTESKTIDSFLQRYSKYDFIKRPNVKVYLATNIKDLKDRLEFTYIDNESDRASNKSKGIKGNKGSKDNSIAKGVSFSIPTSSDHLVSNFLIAIITANYLGINLTEIQRALKAFNMELPRLSIDTGDNNTVIINDSYSSSFKGFKAAVDFMNKNLPVKSSKRIILTKGILELGGHKPQVYKELLTQIKTKFDILITSDPLLAQLAKQQESEIEVIKAKDQIEMVYQTRKIAKPKDIILVEGRVHPDVLKELISDEN